MTEMLHALRRGAQQNREDLIRVLRLTHWIVPVLMAFIGISYTLFEHTRHRGEPAWPWITWFGIVVLGVIGPVLSWTVMHWAIRATNAYLASQGQLEDRADELSTLNKLSTAASRSLDLRQTITAILEQTMTALDAAAAMVFIQDDDPKGLRLEAYRGISLEMAQQEANLLPGHCMCGQAALSRQVLFADDVNDDPRCTSNLCICEGFRSVACAPLEVKGELIGLLQLASPNLNHFTQEQSGFLAAAAAQVSVSIENARLYDKLRTFNVELEQKVNQRTHELEAARWALAEKARQLQRLLSESYRIQEDTQARIAQDMHDGVTQTVIGALYESQAARQLLYEDPDRAIESLARAQKLMSEVETEIKRVIYDLHPPALDMMGIVVALKRYAASFTTTFGISCQVQATGIARRLPRETEISIYRIIQAALHNVVTHAKAKQVQVSFDFGSDWLEIGIEDNGNGFEPSKALANPGEHLGLIGMKERAEGIGADLEVDSKPGQGTRITIHIPQPAYLEENQVS